MNTQRASGSNPVAEPTFRNGNLDTRGVFKITSTDPEGRDTTVILDCTSPTRSASPAWARIVIGKPRSVLENAQNANKYKKIHANKNLVTFVPFAVSLFGGLINESVAFLNGLPHSGPQASHWFRMRSQTPA